jgi:hypothetical protein
MDHKTYKLVRTDDRFEEQEMVEAPDGTHYLKEDVEPIIKAYYALIEKLLYYKNDVRDNMEYRVKECASYKEIMGFPDEELPLRINAWNEGSPQHFLISCRLSGDDPLTKDLSKCIELLWDVEFDMEAYKNIGYNDGLASVTSTLLDIAGMKDEAAQAIDATYNFD